MALPTLTAEQRADALVKAAQARKARAEIYAGLKSGELTFADVLRRAEDDEIVRKTKVVAVIKALPGIGTAKAHQLLGDLKIADTRPCGWSRREPARRPSHRLHLSAPTRPISTVGRPRLTGADRLPRSPAVTGGGAGWAVAFAGGSASGCGLPPVAMIGADPGDAASDTSDGVTVLSGSHRAASAGWVVARSSTPGTGRRPLQ